MQVIMPCPIIQVCNQIGAKHLSAGSSLQEAIASLEASSLQIVLVVDSEGVLQGTLTDGDIRRAFLKGYGLSIPSRHYRVISRQLEVGCRAKLFCRLCETEKSIWGSSC